MLTFELSSIVLEITNDAYTYNTQMKSDRLVDWLMRRQL